MVRYKDRYGPQDDPSYWIATIYAGKYAWEYYVEAGEITSIASAYVYAMDACID